MKYLRKWNNDENGITMAMIQQWQWNNDGHEISMEKAIMAMIQQWQWNNAMK